MSTSHRKLAQVHARPGQKESQVDPSFYLGIRLARALSCISSIRASTKLLLAYSITEVRSQIFQSIDFFKIFFPRSVNELLASEMQKNLGVTNFVSEVKRVENYPDFEK